MKNFKAKKKNLIPLSLWSNFFCCCSSKDYLNGSLWSHYHDHHHHHKYRENNVQLIIKFHIFCSTELLITCVFILFMNSKELNNYTTTTTTIGFIFRIRCVIFSIQRKKKFWHFLSYWIQFIYLSFMHHGLCITIFIACISGNNCLFVLLFWIVKLLFWLIIMIRILYRRNIKKTETEWW